MVFHGFSWFFSLFFNLFLILKTTYLHEYKMESYFLKILRDILIKPNFSLFFQIFHKNFLEKKKFWNEKFQKYRNFSKKIEKFRNFSKISKFHEIFWKNRKISKKNRKPNISKNIEKTLENIEKTDFWRHLINNVGNRWYLIPEYLIAAHHLNTIWTLSETT